MYMYSLGPTQNTLLPLFVRLIIYVPCNNFGVMSGRFLGLTSTKQRLKCLAQHLIVTLGKRISQFVKCWYLSHMIKILLKRTVKSV